MRPPGAERLSGDIGLGDEFEQVLIGQEPAAQHRAAGRLRSGRSTSKEDEVVRGVGIVGQALGQGDADRHLDVARQAAQDLAHQRALALDAAVPWMR